MCIVYFPPLDHSLEEAETPRSPLAVTGRSVGSERPELLQAKMSINRRYGNSERHYGVNRTFTNNRRREPPTPREDNREQRGATRARTNEKELRYGLQDSRGNEPRYGMDVEADKPRYRVHVVQEMDEESLHKGDRYEDTDSARARNEYDANYDDYGERYGNNRGGSDGENEMYDYDVRKGEYDENQQAYDDRSHENEENRSDSYDDRNV